MSWFPPMKLSKCTILINDFVATMTFVGGHKYFDLLQSQKAGNNEQIAACENSWGKESCDPFRVDNISIRKKHIYWGLHLMDCRVLGRSKVLHCFHIASRSLAPCRTFCSPTSQRREIAAFLCPWTESWPFHRCSAPTRATTSAKPSL